MKALLDWIDGRTGYRRLTHEALYENVPGGARWRYVWGSTLTFCFALQIITGIVLWMAYNPSSQTAWESVFYIQHVMWGGWFVRGVHHFAAQAMNVLLVLHLMQVVIDGAYKAPREFNFWSGILLLLIVLGLSLTGYLLPWDQKGYWATKVATNIAAITPVIGPDIQRLIIGGSDYGHHTLSRFLALHAGVLPGAMIALVAAHIYFLRRHGLTSKKPHRKPDAPFWPDQVLKDGVACLAVLAAILLLVLRNRGAELGAPADPSEQFSAARPEWYFMFLFQFLKYFPGSWEIVGAMIIPTVVLAFIAAMPFIGQWRLGHRFNLAFLSTLLAGIGLLTYLAYAEDYAKPTYIAAVASAHRDAQRVVELAKSPSGIPPTGAVHLLRNDPYTQGPKIFARTCASCHPYGGHNGMGEKLTEPASAPDLKDFASRTWIANLLDPTQVDQPHFFGGTRFKDGKMVRFVKRDIPKLSEADKANLQKAIAALSAEAALPTQIAIDQRDATLIREGRTQLASENLRCTECHSFHSSLDDASAPDLTGYGSRDWLIAFIGDPTHTRFYGRRNDRMPAFTKDQVLDATALGLVVDWLRGDWPATPSAAAPQ